MVAHIRDWYGQQVRAEWVENGATTALAVMVEMWKRYTEMCV